MSRVYNEGQSRTMCGAGREVLRKKIIEVNVFLKVFLKPVLMVKLPAYNEPFRLRLQIKLVSTR